ncbi:hypothetical protein ACJX0J_035058, partial [Zea mays]
CATVGSVYINYFDIVFRFSFLFVHFWVYSTCYSRQGARCNWIDAPNSLIGPCTLLFGSVLDGDRFDDAKVGLILTTLGMLIDMSKLKVNSKDEVQLMGVIRFNFVSGISSIIMHGLLLYGYFF